MSKFLVALSILAAGLAGCSALDERGISREAALQGLLEVVIKGRAGEVPARFSPPPDRPST